MAVSRTGEIEMDRSKVLFWYEEATVGNTYTWMDRFITYFDLEMRLIDKVGQFLDNQEPDRLPIAYPDLDSALEDMSDHTWVFLDPNGDHILDEFQHPEGLVVYAFGSNTTGFGQDLSGLGQLVKLRNPDEIYVLNALPLVLYDRELNLAGKR